MEAVNQTYQNYLNNYYNRNSTERAFSIEDRLIASVEKMFSCICYSTISRRFEVYEGKIHGIQEYTRGVRDFSEYIERWSDPVNQAGDCGSQLFKQWFPYSTICLYGGSAPSDDEVAETVEDYLISHDYLNHQIQRGDAEAIKDFINRHLEPYGNRVAGMSLPIRNLGAALKHIGFQLARCGRNGSGQVIITRQETGEAVAPNGTEIDL